MHRRSLLTGIPALPAVLARQHSTDHDQRTDAPFGYPIAWPGNRPGNGFFIRHGYACENTWYNPGFLHTGEDWYARDGETAGAEVLAIAPGRVVFAGSDYPGRVVIIRHEAELYSMYGHLDGALDVAVGDDVTTGNRLGSILLRTDGAAPSHLHVEMRTFLTTPDVNGPQPRYGFACGPNCAPGPGYWPMDAPEHPSALGWRNPTHAITRRMRAARQVVVPDGIDETASLWSLPADRAGATQIGTVHLKIGRRFALISTATGPESTTGWSAERYRLWYKIEQSPRHSGWVQAAVPSDIETGHDDRPSAIHLRLLPA